MEAFVEKAKRFTTIDELTPELLRLFIQRIEIGERDVKYSRNASQSIRIIYRDIGLVDSAMQPDEKQGHSIPRHKTEKLEEGAEKSAPKVQTH